MNVNVLALCVHSVRPQVARIAPEVPTILEVGRCHLTSDKELRMTKLRVVGLLALLVFALTCPSAKAGTVVLTFEGLQDNEQILNFYNGGTGSLGSSGTN